MALEVHGICGFIDFRFIPGSVDQPASSSVVECLVKHIADPPLSPGLKTIPAWMIVSDLRNHPAAVEFISTLSRKHPKMFLNVPWFICLVQPKIFLITRK